MAKKYPFSAQKHAHDIEYYYYYLRNRIDEFYEQGIGTGEKVKKMEKQLERVIELRDEVFWNGNGVVSWISGKNYGLAKEICCWASEMRASHCKPEYRQYC